MTHMRAAIFHGPGDVRIERVPVPEPGPGEVLVRIDAALTDGTDAKCYLRGHPVLLAELPSPFGHEYAGTVAAAGAGAGFAVGDPVAGANSAPCGHCARCLAGREELCTELFPLLNGAYAEYLLVPERITRQNLHRLPAGVEPAVGAMCEPLACALHGVEATEARAGDRVCVLGVGALGQMIAAALAARGCEVVALRSTDPDPPGAFDRVIEAAGQPGAWERAVRLAAPGATVVLFGGLPAGTSVPVDAYRLHYEALTLRGVFHHAPRHVRASLELLARDPAPFRTLITHEFALDDVVVPLEMTAGIRPRDGILKAVIRP
ncbi:MAG: L-iditol 2-dehydrogenase [Gaiellaceae bacterium]|nr:L-iditol 2-dehydrogenase [Gaiellaceae bacterium]